MKNVKMLTPKDLIQVVEILESYEIEGVDSHYGLCSFVDKKHKDSDFDVYDLISPFVSGSESYLGGIRGYTKDRVELSKLLAKYFSIGFTETISYSKKHETYKFKTTPEGEKIRRRIRYMVTGK